MVPWGIVTCSSPNSPCWCEQDENPVQKQQATTDDIAAAWRPAGQRRHAERLMKTKGIGVGPAPSLSMSKTVNRRVLCRQFTVCVSFLFAVLCNIRSMTVYVSRLSFPPDILPCQFHVVTDVGSTVSKTAASWPHVEAAGKLHGNLRKASTNI
jgi:hypothetical protein